MAKTIFIALLVVFLLFFFMKTENDKDYVYFVSFSYAGGRGSIHSLPLNQRITAENVDESIKVIKKEIERDKEIDKAVVTNFILLK